MRCKAVYDKNAFIIDGKRKFLLPDLGDLHGRIPMGNDMPGYHQSPFEGMRLPADGLFFIAT